MLLHTFDFFAHRRKKHKRLALAMMVRDEDDIIERNIRFHAHYGVEKFFIVNNASIDKTQDILQKMQADFNIWLEHEPDATSYRTMQASTMTRLNQISKQEGFNWVINCDADEFWLPLQTNNLKDLLDNRVGTVTAQRANVLPCTEIPDILQSPYIIDNPINYPNRRDLKQYFNFMLEDPSGKVITQTHGLKKLRHGNHKCEHASYDFPCSRNIRKYNITLAKEQTLCFHFQVRSIEQFSKRIAVDKSVMGDPKRKSSVQRGYRLAQLQTKSLEEVYADYVFSTNELQVLEKFHVVIRNTAFIEAYDRVFS